MAAVMIGIDPPKASHTAAAAGPAEELLGQVRMRACASQAEQLVGWARDWPERTWAVEAADGLGKLLAQQLVAAGERVVDVQPKLAARVRLLESGNTNKNDADDARSVAIAALRPAAPRDVTAEDYPAVLKMWAKRHRDLSRSRTQAACRLHAVLCDLVPGGFGKEITAGQAARLLERITPSGAVQKARHELAAGLLAGLRHLDAQLRDTKKQLTVAVRASGTSLTGIFGVGPVTAATIIGVTGEVSRIHTPDRFAACNGTAPVEVSSGERKIWRLPLRGNRRLNHALHTAAVTQIRYPHSEGRAYYEKKIAEGKTGKEALRALKRRLSDATFARLQAGAARAAAAPARSEPGRATGEPLCLQGGRLTPRTPALRASHSQARLQPATPATGPAPGSLPAPLPPRASGQPGQGPGQARPRSNAAKLGD
jgi:transposase